MKYIIKLNVYGKTRYLKATRNLSMVTTSVKSQAKTFNSYDDAKNFAYKCANCSYDIIPRED